MPSIPAPALGTRELQLLDDEFSKSVRQRDAEHLVDCFYAADGQIHVSAHAAIQGRAALIDYWRRRFRFGLLDLKRESNQFEIENDLACAVGRYTLTRETHPGLLDVERGKFAAIYRRQDDGRWRAVVDSFSAND